MLKNVVFLIPPAVIDCRYEFIESCPFSCGSARLLRTITRMLNQILEGDSIPEEWLLSFITPIFKEGSKKDPSNYRGISVMASMSRLFSKIITLRIENSTSTHISEEQAGSTAGKSCLDNIFTLRQIMEK